MGPTTHAICEACWPTVEPDRKQPVRIVDKYAWTEACCFCGVQTRSGIYVRRLGERPFCKHGGAERAPAADAGPVHAGYVPRDAEELVQAFAAAPTMVEPTDLERWEADHQLTGGDALPRGTAIRCPACRNIAYILRRDMHRGDRITSETIMYGNGLFVAAGSRLQCYCCSAVFRTINIDTRELL